MRDTVQRVAGGGIAVGEDTANGLMRAPERGFLLPLVVGDGIRGRYRAAAYTFLYVSEWILSYAISTWVVPRVIF